MISYVPTSLAWPSPSPKKTQDPKTLTYKVKHFLPPYQKKWKKGKQKAEEPLSGKDRLMVLLLAEKAATRVALKPSSSFRPTTAAYDLETSSTETETSQKNGLFQSLRQSFRRKKISILRQQHPGDISHDSGLGEDSDSPLSPRTSPLTPILRTPSCNCNSKPLKQVMIREPSLKHLPSAIRNSYPGAMPADKPQLVKLQHRHYRYSYHADNMVGDVSGQWNSLYFRAAQEVRLRQEGCDKVCDLIFSTNHRRTEDKLLVMETEEIDQTIHLLYKILFYDWLSSSSPTTTAHLSIILHCVQKFLILLVDVCPDLERTDRSRLSICCKGLLRQAEDAKYAPIKDILQRTRTQYIQVWCAILCVPFHVP